MTLWRYSAALDNHEPVRSTAYGSFERTIHPVNGTDTIVLDAAASALKDATSALWLIDDGETVQPFYVAGWNPRDPGVILNPMPTNPGNRTMRADGRGPVSYATWALGPRRAYHLKVYRPLIADAHTS